MLVQVTRNWVRCWTFVALKRLFLSLSSLFSHQITFRKKLRVTSIGFVVLDYLTNCFNMYLHETFISKTWDLTVVKSLMSGNIIRNNLVAGREIVQKHTLQIFPKSRITNATCVLSKLFRVTHICESTN